ncbi:MAG TPA: hypothetical protein PK129_03560 [Cellvibrionaceae bacterium]|nr:hypothetical protein [Cellvibrionaceae bacterium]
MHYTVTLADRTILNMLDYGVQSVEDTEHLTYFILQIIDAMAKWSANNIGVFGGTDKASMASDIAYDLGALMDANGFGAIWKKISEDA